MIEFVAGIAVGAVFAPFWLKVWIFIKDRAKSLAQDSENPFKKD